jgi:ABC-type multidrug transport system fused ATPase/permease subunit
VIDKADRKKMTDWFWSRSAAEAEKEHEPLLEVRNLTFGYERGRQTLRDVSLTIQKGEMVSIVGKNGAGKSTFSKLGL